VNILFGIEFVLIVGAVIIAILSQVRTMPILYLAVILIAIAEALGRAGSLSGGMVH
jgi:hypothetical protein